jgi:spore germination protein KB
MNREIISGKQLKNLIIVYLMGAALVASGSAYAKHCAWISEIASIIIAIPIVLMYARLSCISKGKNIFDLFQDSLGKFIGCIFTLLFLIYSIYLGSAVIRNFTEFVQIVFFPDTPQYTTAIFAFCTILYIINKGIEPLARAVSSVAYLLIGVMLMLVVFSLGDMDFSNILPIFSEKISVMAKESFFLLSLPYLEIVMFLGLGGSFKKGDSLYKAYVYGLVISGVVLLLAFLRNIFVLGTHVMEQVYFPAYTSTSLIDIADFITRIEVIASSTYTFSIIIQSAVCFITACKGVAKLANIKDYKVFSAPACLLGLYLSKTMFKSTQALFGTIIKGRVPVFLVQFLIPLITWIAAEIKFGKKSENLPKENNA